QTMYGFRTIRDMSTREGRCSGWQVSYPNNSGIGCHLVIASRGRDPRGSNLGPTEAHPHEIASSRDALLAMTFDPCSPKRVSTGANTRKPARFGAVRARARPEFSLQITANNSNPWARPSASRARHRAGPRGLGGGVLRQKFLDPGPRRGERRFGLPLGDE